MKLRAKKIPHFLTHVTHLIVGESKEEKLPLAPLGRGTG